jgi:pimeloyl-ACP methyl ester carboxylesterase
MNRLAALGFGAGIGCAIANALADRRAEARHASSSRAGERVLVRGQAGQGDVVLLHGNGAMIEDMELSGLVDRLGRERRVVVPDRPGYGASALPQDRPWSVTRHADFVAGLIGREKLDRPVVLGQSLGALVALALALDHPETVRGLVLVSGFYTPDPQFSIVAQKIWSLPVIGPALVATTLPQLAQATLPLVSKQLFAPLPVPERFHRLPKDLLLRRSHLQSTADGASLLEEDAARYGRHIQRLRVPVHLFAGEDDHIIRAMHHAEAFRERYRPAVLTPLPGTGHMAHYSATDAIARAVLDLGG